jgi:hypothetical protein
VNPAAGNLDDHALAAHYEVLRRNVVASADRRHTLHSLALLMRRGMAAWIKDVGQELPVREDITPPTPIKYQYQRKNRANSMASAVGRNSINS